MTPDRPTIGVEKNNWQERHPLLSARNNKEGFVCFHTHNLTWDHVDNSINRSVEIDTQEVDETVGDYLPDVVVSHHPWAYPIYGNNPPKQENMMRAAEVVEAVQYQNVFVKFDIKSASQFTYDWIVYHAKKMKPERRMLHVFPKELHAVNVRGISNPYKQDAPQTVAELVELKDLENLKDQLDGIPVQVSCRGFTFDDISKKEGENFPVIDELCERVKNVAEVINFNLKGGWGNDVNKTEEVIEYVWNKHGMMVELNIDAGESAPVGIPFLGRSDKMEKVTELK